MLSSDLSSMSCLLHFIMGLQSAQNISEQIKVPGLKHEIEVRMAVLKQITRKIFESKTQEVSGSRRTRRSSTGVNVRITQEMSKSNRTENVGWSHVTQDGKGFCDHGNEHSDSTNWLTKRLQDSQEEVIDSCIIYFFKKMFLNLDVQEQKYEPNRKYEHFTVRYVISYKTPNI